MIMYDITTFYKPGFPCAPVFELTVICADLSHWSIKPAATGDPTRNAV